MNAKVTESDRDQVEPIDWPTPVLRVTLHWDGEAWTAGDAIRVPSMTLPRSDPTDPGKTTGFWVDALDAGGRLSYRVRMNDPLRGMEFFEESGDVSRFTHKGHEVDIEILVPDRASVTELEIISNANDRPDGSKPYTARLSIDRDRIRDAGSEPPPSDHVDGHGDHHR